jgi:hypothetical protein
MTDDLRRFRSRRSAALLLLLLAASFLVILPGCELRQITVAEPESAVVVEIYLRVDLGRPDGLAFLHRTFGPGERPPPEASIRLRSDSGEEAHFIRADPEACLDGELPEGLRPSCYRLDGPEAALIRPGARLEVEVELMGGGRLEGNTVVPGDFSILTPAGLEFHRGGEGEEASTALPVCVIPPSSPLLLSWTSSRGVWAYVPEMEIRGLRAALAPSGIEVERDSLTLLGLAVSEADTTIVFPGGFGVFSRFSGDREVLVALQEGLPPGDVQGRVVVSAADRNTTNWNRGGNFNPSGLVRVPSLFGDGTGVLGSVVNRGFDFQAGGDPGGALVCAPASAGGGGGPP